MTKDLPSCEKVKISPGMSKIDDDNTKYRVGNGEIDQSSWVPFEFVGPFLQLDKDSVVNKKNNKQTLMNDC